ncbi:ABC transporter permease subunit [Streptosporangiaceae bacterium NEAU-GS5]|nr:ABC transporter permease subunit [Streptosporangiaceae bacterium NEAU-GS5]
MSVSGRRIRAIVRKELREYRRTPSIVVTMAVIPLIFLIQPLILIFTLPAAAADQLAHGHVLLYLLGVPALVPVLVAAYAVTGERQQGTLEPALSTPIRRAEFLLGKALAALVPSVAVAYGVSALFIALVALFADPSVASALLRWPQILAQVVFTPLIAGWSIWAGLAISAKSNDIRTSQQLGVLTALPSLGATSLIAFDVIHLTPGLVIALAAALLLLNGLGRRIVAPLFDRERLITGTR